MESVLEVLRCLRLKFGQNRVSNSWDIWWGVLVLVLVVVVVVVVTGVNKVNFKSSDLRLKFDNTYNTAIYFKMNNQQVVKPSWLWFKMQFQWVHCNPNKTFLQTSYTYYYYLWHVSCCYVVVAISRLLMSILSKL